MADRIMLGQALFPYQFCDSGYSDQNRGEAEIFEQISRARRIDDIEDALFVLKLPPRNAQLSRKNTTSIILVLEKVLQDLMRPDLTERLRPWDATRFADGEFFSIPEMVLQSRERIGRIALEVFFETIFDRNKKAFWEYLASIQPPHWTWESGGPPNTEVLEQKFTLDPISLCVFLNYLAVCNETTKHVHKGSIRKFLKDVCNDPLEIHGEKMGISTWTDTARQTLANALVRNGMYEECLDYNLPEAYHYVVHKFLGRFHDGDDGLMHSSCHSNHPICKTHLKTPQQAIEKACKDKELGHILGVLVRLAVNHNHAKLTKTFDVLGEPIELRSSGSPNTVESVNMRLAILWNDPISGSGL